MCKANVTAENGWRIPERTRAGKALGSKVQEEVSFISVKDSIRPSIVDVRIRPDGTLADSL